MVTLLAQQLERQRLDDVNWDSHEVRVVRLVLSGFWALQARVCGLDGISLAVTELSVVL